MIDRVQNNHQVLQGLQASRSFLGDSKTIFRQALDDLG